MVSLTERALASLIPLGIGVFLWCVSSYVAKKYSEGFKVVLKSKSSSRFSYQSVKWFFRGGGIISIGIGLWIFFTVKNVNF